MTGCDDGRWGQAAPAAGGRQVNTDDSKLSGQDPRRVCWFPAGVDGTVTKARPPGLWLTRALDQPGQHLHFPAHLGHLGVPACLGSLPSSRGSCASRVPARPRGSLRGPQGSLSCLVPARLGPLCRSLGSRASRSLASSNPALGSAPCAPGAPAPPGSLCISGSLCASRGSCVSRGP